MLKSMTKSQLALLAGVSLSTFGRWLRQHNETLLALGVSRNAHILPPHAVRYVCDTYGIDL